MVLGNPVIRMKAARVARGWSQTALAATAGRLSASDISRFETGYARPYPVQAGRLAQVLELRPDELLAPVDER